MDKSATLMQEDIKTVLILIKAYIFEFLWDTCTCKNIEAKKLKLIATLIESKSLTFKKYKYF